MGADVFRRWSAALRELPSSVAKLTTENQYRDLLLLTMNTHFEDATGETFSKQGKTDLRVLVRSLRESDGDKVVFKAECKVWRGPRSAAEALSQLVDLYLTEGETRAALIFFARSTPRAQVEALAVSALQGLGLVRRGDIAGWPVLRHRTGNDQVVDLAVVVVPVAADATRPPRAGGPN